MFLAPLVAVTALPIAPSGRPGHDAARTRAAIRRRPGPGAADVRRSPVAGPGRAAGPACVLPPPRPPVASTPPRAYLRLTPTP